MGALAIRELIAEAPERRGNERVPLDIQVTVHFKGGTRWTETDAALVDLSAHGMFVRTDRNPTGGHRILLGILHEELGLCAAWGRAIRFDGWGGFGVRFGRTNAPLLSFIRRMSLLSPSGRSDALTTPIDARIWIEADRLHR